MVDYYLEENKPKDYRTESNLPRKIFDKLFAEPHDFIWAVKKAKKNSKSI